MRDVIRGKHYISRRDQAQLEWAKRYILFHGTRHPKDMRSTHIVAFLTHLAVAHNVASSIQRPALNALVFRYKQVPGCEDLALDTFESSTSSPLRTACLFGRLIRDLGLE